MRLSRWWLLGLALVTLAGCERKLTPDQGHRVLQRVQQARRTLCLQGKLTTYVRVPDQELRADGEMYRGPGVIRLKYTSGRFAGWQIIEQDGLVWRVGPDGRPSASPIGPEAGLGLPAEGDLDVSYLGLTRVAGRWARRYVVYPRGGQLARLVVAVDAGTLYPLQMQRYGPAGRLVSETTYRDIRYNVAPPPKVAPPPVAEQHRPGDRLSRGTQKTEKELVKLLGGPLLKPSYVPHGLQLRGFYARETRRGTLAEIRYSDGLRTLVVAQMKAPVRRPGAQPDGRRVGGRDGRQQPPSAAPPSPGGAEGRPGGWWQRFGGGDGQRGGEGNQAGGRAGRSLLHERRGARVVIVSGDLGPDELRKVLASVPYPAGEKPGTKF